MIVLKELSLRYGEKVIFDDCTGAINARDAIGLVGPNGAGKSTLLKLLADQQEIDSGDVEMAGYVTVGYLPQDGIDTAGSTLYKEVETAFATVLSLRAEIEEASGRLKALSPESEEYHDLLEVIGEKEMQLADLEPQKLRSRIEKVLLGLGFKTSDMERDTGEFSGGWQMRIALAKLLLREPSILLMDEPTNHLDLPSQRWLENYLKTYRGALMLVSHDRAFLDTICNRIFELGRGRLTIYTGNYSHYLIEKEQREEALKQAYRTQQKQIEKTEQFIDRFRAKATKAKQVQSRIKALDKIERIEIDEQMETVGFRFPEPERSGDRVIKLEGLTKRYGDLTVFENLSFDLSRGDKIAVVGVNGAGKSTLAKVLAGVEPYQGGIREVGHRVSIGYFAQHQARELDTDSSPLQVLEECDEMGGERSRLRTILGSFLFHGDDVFKKVAVLSGGEKNRLALAKLLTTRNNFLIFDEPTNHLDMASKEVLQRALGEFGGSFLIVSHDRSFLDPIVTKVLEISPNRVRFFPGTVSEYIAKVEDEEKQQQALASRQQGAANQAARAVANSDGLNPKERRRLEAEKRKTLTPLKQQVDKLESLIGELEDKVAKYELLMAEEDFYKDPEEAKNKTIEYQQVKDKLTGTYESWEKATAEYEEKKEAFGL